MLYDAETDQLGNDVIEESGFEEARGNRTYLL